NYRLVEPATVIRLLQVKYSVRRKRRIECQQRSPIVGPAQGAKSNHVSFLPQASRRRSEGSSYGCLTGNSITTSPSVRECPVGMRGTKSLTSFTPLGTSNSSVRVISPDPCDTRFMT